MKLDFVILLLFFTFFKVAKANIQSCYEEPVHLLNLVQPFGYKFNKYIF